MPGCPSSTSSCHCPQQKENLDAVPEEANNPAFQIFITVLEKISAVALTAFACYVHWQLFVPFFALGIALGVYTYLAEKSKKDDHNHSSVSSCSQGFMEQITGVKLPPLVSLVCNVLATYVHLEHHSILGSVVAVTSGAWAGKYIAQGCSLLFCKVTKHSAEASSSHSHAHETHSLAHAH